MIENLTVEDAQYYIAYYPDGVTEAARGINATIDGIQTSVPLDPANRHYAEIMRQVEAGELVIAEAV